MCQPGEPCEVSGQTCTCSEMPSIALQWLRQPAASASTSALSRNVQSRVRDFRLAAKRLQLRDSILVQISINLVWESCAMHAVMVEDV